MLPQDEVLSQVLFGRTASQLAPLETAQLASALTALATGGTIEACTKLVKESQAEIVGCAFVIELTFLNGRSRLAPHDIFSLIQYDDEN